MTKFIPTSDVVVRPKRQRKEFNQSALADLRLSIEKIGLMQPIVCRVEGDEVVLVAGERRLRAINDLYELGGSLRFGDGEAPYGTIPYTDIGELSELDAMEAELEENIRREDLTWQERCEAVANLAALRETQALVNNTPPPTNSDLAREVIGELDHLADGELGYYRDTVRKDLILADHLNDPDIAGAKTAKEAFKILQRKDTASRNAEVGRRLGEGTVSDGHQLVSGDAVEWARGQTGSQFAVILTDPPYGMGADEFGESGRAGEVGAHFYKDTPENFHALMAKIIPETYRLAASDAHLYLFCDIGWFEALSDWCKEAGWNVFRTPLIWYSSAKFRAPWPEHGPQRKYETILYARKGDRKVNKLVGDVLEFGPDLNLGHQAQKPIALFSELLKRSIRPGERVLDLFGGTGVLFPAAQENKCFATVVEQDPSACGIAAQRLKTLRGG